MSVTRRGFIQGVAAGALTAGAARAGSLKHFAGYPGRYGLLHDSTLCVGCRSCEFACNQVQAPPLPPPAAPIDDKRVFTGRRRISEKLYTVVNRYREAQGLKPAVYRKHQCMHCNEPCCASVCFVDAFTKTPEGPVLYHPELCVGCRYCVFACPYYALAYEYADPLTPRVVRCTMCHHRIKQGLNPACADACPNGAIVFGRRLQLLHLARERMRKFPGRYIDHIFGESEYGGTSWLTLSGVPFGRLDLPEDLPHEPLPNLTTGFLSLAPLAAAIFPGLLAGFYAFTKRREALGREEREKLVAEERARQAEQLEQRLLDLAREAERDRKRSVDWAVKQALRKAREATDEEDGHGPGA